MANEALDSLTNFGSSSTNLGSSTIIVQNGNNRAANNGGCLPCNDETVCTVAPSSGSRLDLSKIKSSNSRVRFNVDTTNSENAATDSYMQFITKLKLNLLSDYMPSVGDYFGDAQVGGTFDEGGGDGSEISGVEASAFMMGFNNNSIGGGATTGTITVQYNATLYPQLDGMTLSAYRIPIDPNDSLEVDEIYSPLCDFCASSGNGSFTTHKYTVNIPITYRNGLAVFVPGATGGARFTLDMCFSTNGFPNTEQTTWADSGA